MKLILKRLNREIEVTSLDSDSRHYVPGGRDQQASFALHAEDGAVLPNQLSTTLHSDPGQPVRLTVVFMVDGNKLAVEGDGM
ncbi:hypothetical protein DM819_21645 [Pseudomonas hunanensis]|uniref:Uncharacterized protein n=1 Tax=Pseudomonas hunanensis TaxID=1247546 RepID=A0ABD6NBB3_9PSED|nr:hypothetical protein [Pseudomonas hunanensis]NWL48397.1 hypothetical protein [Pseudomonas hunanensis]